MVPPLVGDAALEPPGACLPLTVAGVSSIASLPTRYGPPPSSAAAKYVRGGSNSRKKARRDDLNDDNVYIGIEMAELAKKLKLDDVKPIDGINKGEHESDEEEGG